MTTTERSPRRPSDGASGSASDLDKDTDTAAGVTRAIADVVAGASADAGARLSEATESAGVAVRDVDRQIRASSDQTLGILGALSVGLSIGLLLGGVNRLLVVAALAPAAFVAAAAVERLDRGAQQSRVTVH